MERLARGTATSICGKGESNQGSRTKCDDVWYFFSANEVPARHPEMLSGIRFLIRSDDNNRVVARGSAMY